MVIAAASGQAVPSAETVARARTVLDDPALFPGELREALDRQAMETLAGRLLDADDPVAKHLRGWWETGTEPAIRAQLQPPGQSSGLVDPLRRALNLVVRSDRPGYRPDVFAGVALSAETRALIAEKPTGLRLQLLHRRLLEDWLGEAVVRYQTPRFVGEGTEHGRRVYALRSSIGTASYDQETGRLASYWLHSGSPDGPAIGLEAAEQAALSWLASQGVAVDGWTRWTTGEHGSEPNQCYAFGWAKFTEQRIKLPAEIYVNMKLNGRVIDALYRDEPVEIDLVPRVSRAEAVKLATKAVDDRPGQVVSAFVSVDTADGGRQRLVWSVHVQHGDESSWVRLDALTGELVRVDVPSASPAKPRWSPLKPPLDPALALAGLAAITAAALALRRRRRV